MSPHSATLASLPRVVLKSRRALPFYNRHPWVFAGAIADVPSETAPGAEVALVSSGGEFIARGLYNPHSNIRVRLYSWKETEPLDRDFWSRRIDAALDLRRSCDSTNRSLRSVGPQLADRGSSAGRLVYSEADGLSGLIVDRYGDWLVVQLTSLALAERRDLFIELLREKLQPAGVWLRTEKGIRESEGLELSDGLLWGKEPPRPLFIEEHGIRYGVDVREGQKTGFYLDQRENRAAVARYLNDSRVLDLFCYTGGFGLAAVKLGGARAVVGVDVSEPALALARANVELAGVSEKFRFEQGRAFDVIEKLQAAGGPPDQPDQPSVGALGARRCPFDAVILDPPKMTRRRAGAKQALRGYHSLNRLALDVLRPGGLLVTCSCSGLIDRDAFEQMLADVSLRADRPIRILESRGQSPDHPVSVHCPENDYLKCYICHVE